MAGEETILDAPVTPAPLFAYRALRAMFVGSPETPAIATNRKFSSRSNKENEQVQVKTTQTRDSTFKWTPTQKRKPTSTGNSMLSPTKSCLRTPGAVTPRRELLRDVNVTFKDALRQSISPQHVLNNKDAKTTSEDAEKVKRKTYKKPLATTKAVHNVALINSPPQSLDSSHPLPSTEQIINAPDFNMQNYMNTTEKEMKKLIRYSQKMREYARKQDEENAKLKKLVEELKNENTRLKRKSDTMEEDNSGSRDVLPPQHHPTKPDHKRRRIYNTDAHGQNQTVAPDDLTSKARPVLGILQDTQINSLRARNTTISDQNNVLDNINPPKPISVVDRHKQDYTTFPAQSGLKPDLNTRMAIPLRIAPQSTSATTTAAAAPPPPPSNINTIHANLAPDRLAAARARIRQRSETRKTSAFVLNIPMHHESNDTSRHVDRPNPVKRSHDRNTLRTNPDAAIGDHHGSSRRDSSMLDWEGL